MPPSPGSPATSTARRRIEEALRVGRAAGDPDLVAMAIHTEGLVLIDQGKVDEGLALLDEAMASIVAGEVDPYFTGIIYCDLIGACLSVSDLRRAGEWSDAARAWCDTIPPDSPYPGMCRANRAEVARLRGAWPEAEAEAVSPRRAAHGRARDRGGGVPPGRRDPPPHGRPGRRRGRVHPRARAGPGPAARARAAPARPGEDGRRAFGDRRRPRGPVRSPPRRARLLAAQVEIALADGEIDAARAAADELARSPTDRPAGLRGAWRRPPPASSRWRRATPPTALAQLRDAVAAWQDLRLPYEAARARVALRAGAPRGRR